MVEYKKVRRLEHEFERLRLSRDDLKKLCVLLKNCVSDAENHELDIDIVDIDGVDTTTTSDPEIFSGDINLKKIGSVKSSLNVRDTNTRIELYISKHSGKYAKFYVQSNDEILASGILQEFKQELKSYEVWGKSFKTWANSTIGSFIFSITCALSVFCVFDVLLKLLYLWNPELKGAPLSLTLIGIGWICTFIVFFEGSSFVNNLIDRALPAVEFTGELGVEPSKSIMLLIRWFTYIFLPILLNIISDLIEDHFKDFINVLNRLS